MTKNIQKLAILLLATITFSSASAQLFKSYPKIGDIITKQYANTYEIAEGSEGSDEFWDMTQLTDSIGKNFVGYIDLKNSNYYSSFPNATHVSYSVNEGVTDTTFLYYFLDSAVGFYYNLGNAKNQTVDVYSNSYKIQKFPTNFGDTFSDYYSSLKNNIRANAFIKSDAKGSLKLPWGTYGVMRIKSTTNLTLEIGGNDYNGIIDNFTFYDTIDSKEILAITYTSGDFNKTKTAYYNADEKLKANISFKKTLKNINIYPNPSNDFIEISDTENHTFTEYTIFNIEGKLIKSEKLNQNKIDIKELNEGVYFLYLKDKNQNAELIGKFIKSNMK